ncbi:hypothetical protein ACFL58_03050 [Elusimicrobiota bacterium]
MHNYFRGVSMALFSFVLLLFVGCGDNNIFSFAHSPGASSSISALSSDAYAALQNGDYPKAIEYYSKILESDPNNSEAIYGYSAAKLADSGLDISSLVANLISNDGDGAPALQAGRLSYAVNSIVYAAGDDDLLPATIIANKEKIKAALAAVLDSTKLKKIIKNLTDGKISADNADVNINIAFSLLLRAAIIANEKGLDFSSEYEASAGVDSPEIQVAAKDIVSAYHRLKVVIAALNLDNDSALASIRDDMESLYNSLPAATKSAIQLTMDYYLNTDY